MVRGGGVELETKIREDFTIVEKAFSWLKTPTSTFTLKKLLRYYASKIYYFHFSTLHDTVSRHANTIIIRNGLFFREAIKNSALLSV